MKQSLSGILAIILLAAFMPLSAINANALVTITAPSNGQTYKSDDTISIEWTATTFPSNADVDIYLYPLKSPIWDASNPIQYIDSESSLRSGDITIGKDTVNLNRKFSWKIPAYMATQTKSYAINIRMFDYAHEPTNELDEWSSGYLTITKSATKPTLQTMSPSEGVAGTLVQLNGLNFFPTNVVTYSSQSGAMKTIVNVSGYDTKTASFKLPEDLIDGTYQIALTTEVGTSNSIPFTVTSTPGKQHPAGTNIVSSNGTVYRIVEGNTRAGYTSAGAFLSYKFNRWIEVGSANGADVALPISSSFIPPRNGSLINDKGTVYLIIDGLRAGFTSEAAFKGLRYSYANVYPGDTSFMKPMAPINSFEQTHPNGTLINDNGTLYVMRNGYRVGFPNMAVLESWGYWVSEAVPANSYDRQAEISGVVQTRMENQLSI